jgi:DNA-binding transcriptional LysR family regulator
MSIRWFKTFITVARHGSFAAAAQQIGLTQAAVGGQMTALEEKLRVKLFDRSARTTVLNTAGRELAARAQQLVDLYDNIGVGLDERQLGGVLALGAIHHTFARLLPDALMLLRESHPGIIVHVCNGVSNELMHKVEQGELDAAVVSQPPFRLGKNLGWHTLVAEPLALVTPANTRLTGLAETLANNPFIGISHNSWTGQLTRSLFRRHRLKVNEVMELNSLEAIAAMVARGFGISILPLSGYVWALEKRVKVRLLNEPEFVREIGLIHRQDQAHPALVSAMRDSLLATIPKAPPGRLRRIAMDS